MIHKPHSFKIYQLCHVDFVAVGGVTAANKRVQFLTSWS